MRSVVALPVLNAYSSSASFSLISIIIMFASIVFNFENLPQQHDSSYNFQVVSCLSFVGWYENFFIPFFWYFVFCPNSP
jgi:hypothetical protein